MTRPRLLTHWTGKDIDNQYGGVGALGSRGRSRYVERLKSVLHGGLWMSTPSEHLQGRADVYVEYRLPMTCFTELRASSAKQHSAIYGHLGIVVDRSFVLARQGGPVRYVWSRHDDLTVGRLYTTQVSLKELLKSARNREDATEVARIHGLLDLSAWTIAFTKDMGARNGTFAQLDEEEWRIVADKDIPELQATGEATPPFKVPLKPEDVRVLIVPDSETRYVVSTDAEIRDWFGPGLPPILAGDDVSQL